MCEEFQGHHVSLGGCDRHLVIRVLGIRAKAHKKWENLNFVGNELVSVGVRRQNRSPPSTAISSLGQCGSSQAKPPPGTAISALGQRGSSQAKPQPSQHCHCVIGSVWEFAGLNRRPPPHCPFLFEGQQRGSQAKPQPLSAVLNSCILLERIKKRSSWQSS